jgi:pentatricopeptide repeat protein
MARNILTLYRQRFYAKHPQWKKVIKYASQDPANLKLRRLNLKAYAFIPEKLDQEYKETVEMMNQDKSKYLDQAKKIHAQMIYSKAWLQDFHGSAELLKEGNVDVDVVLSRIYMRQGFYGQALETTKSKLTKIKAYIKMGYFDKVIPEIVTLRDYTTLLAGFAFNGKIQAMELLYQKMKKLFKLDGHVYNTMMLGYARDHDYDKVLEIFAERSKRFKPHIDTFNILDYCYLFSKDERFGTILSNLTHLKNTISEANRLAFELEHEDLPYADLIIRLEDSPNLFDINTFVARLLRILVKKKDPNLHSFITFVINKGVILTSEVYAQLILVCGRTLGQVHEAWFLYEEMIRKDIPRCDRALAHLIGIGLRTTNTKRLRQIVDDVKVTMRSKRLYRGLLYLFTSVRPRCFDFRTIQENNLIPFLKDKVEPVTYQRYIDEDIEDFPEPKRKNVDSGQSHYTTFAIEILEEMLKYEIKILPTTFRNLVQVATIPATKISQQHIVKLHELKNRLSEPGSKRLDTIFWRTLFLSSRWDLVQHCLSVFWYDQHIAMEILENVITQKASDRDSQWLFTLSKKMPLSNDLLVLLVEALGVNCRNAELVMNVYKNISPSKKSEEVIWAYVRSLLWLGLHKEAVRVATIDYNPTSSGFVVRELAHWCRLMNLKDLEQTIRQYWNTRNCNFFGIA